MPLKCTKCSQPRRGHVGPADEGCTLADAGPGYGLGVHEELSAEESEQSEQEKLDTAGGGIPMSPLKKRSPRKRSEAFAMKELLIQMGNLACTVQRMTEENKLVSEAQKKQQSDMKLLRSAITASSKKPATVTPPVITPQPQPRPLLAPPYQPASFNPLPADNTAPDAGAGAATLQGTHTTGLDQSLPLPNGARISKKTFLSARSGEYINLSEFAPNSEPSSIMESAIDETTGNLVFKSKNIKRAIDCFLSWSRAWAGYESLLISINHTLYQTLSN